MSITQKEVITEDGRFKGLTPFAEKCWLSSPTMHGEELTYIEEAFRTNWVSTLGANIDAVERELAERTGMPGVVALSNGTAALHLAIRLAGIRLYGQPENAYEGTLKGHRVFCTDMTFDATINPVAYEGGEAVFIDSERETWNMSPVALEEAFRAFPGVKLVVMAHLYGTPAKIREIREVCDRHGALLVEDAAESLGAGAGGSQTGSFGDVGIVSFNGNKIITGSCGGAVLTKSEEDAALVRKWSTQARDAAPWYQHSQLGYNYRMSNIVAGVIRGQLLHLEEHIAQKTAVYERYREAFRDLPVSMNPIGEEGNTPNYWLSCLLLDPEVMCETRRTDHEPSWVRTPGKTCPDEILQALSAFNAEGRPIWKPMHMQPIYKGHAYVTEAGVRTCTGGADPADDSICADIFARGLCLPSDNKMTEAAQERVTEIVRACFR
ncbi:MAG: DegT/DnrJ/EryC1/StrS family aminotransferase [Lachnospiraceae bacterium]|nr:DegT/DnrJ/EryC1/StrS family aminotransferase [Lachnospiraceae bacterium]